MPTTSLSRRTSFITFMDNYSHFWFHLPLWTKDEVSHKFKEVLASLPQGTHVHTIQSDCSSEFIRVEFTSVLQEHRIQLKTTPPYTPKYNGVTECSGWTAMEMVHVMLKLAGMLRLLWAEALAYTTTLINYMLMLANAGVSPYELWTKQKPHLTALRAFGTCAYLHVLWQLHNKLDDVARVVWYLGLAWDTSHYCVWIIGMCGVTELCSVVFSDDAGSPCGVLGAVALEVGGETKDKDCTFSTSQRSSVDQDSPPTAGDKSGKPEPCLTPESHLTESHLTGNRQDKSELQQTLQDPFELPLDHDRGERVDHGFIFPTEDETKNNTTGLSHGPVTLKPVPIVKPR